MTIISYKHDCSKIEKNLENGPGEDPGKFPYYSKSCLP